MRDSPGLGIDDEFAPLRGAGRRSRAAVTFGSPGCCATWSRVRKALNAFRTHHISLARIRQLEKENSLLKQLLAEKELEGRLKSELLKKQYALEKKRR